MKRQPIPETELSRRSAALPQHFTARHKPNDGGVVDSCSNDSQRSSPERREELRVLHDGATSGVEAGERVLLLPRRRPLGPSGEGMLRLVPLSG